MGGSNPQTLIFFQNYSHKLVLGEVAHFYALGAKLFQKKFFWTTLPNIQALKHVWVLTWSKTGRAEKPRQFISFNDLWILAIYCNYLHGFKNVRNVTKMALKLLFLLQNYPAAGGFASKTPLLYAWVASGCSARGQNLDNLCAPKFTFGSALSLLAKSCLTTGRIHCCRQIFQAIVWARYETC